MFNPTSIRDDTGSLWENYVIAEFHKSREYKRSGLRYHFWRTYDRQEIDLVAEDAGSLSAYEIKWQNKHVKPPKAWRDNYPAADFSVINRDNYLKYIL